MSAEPDPLAIERWERQARNAAVASFFLPPLGAIWGAVVLHRLRGEKFGNARALALGALANGVISTLVIAKLIWWAPRLIAWARSLLEPGA